MFLRARNHPGLATALIDYLCDTGPQPEADLQALFVPEGLRPTGSSSEGQWAGELTFANTVGALVEADVLHRTPKKKVISCADDFLAEQKRMPERTLTVFLLDEARTGKDPFGGKEGATADLAKLVTWYLDIDPTGPWPNVGSKQEANPLDRLQADADRTLRETPLPDGTSWTRFTRWASALGLAELRPEGALDPDPTEAIGAVLPGLLTDDLPISEFLLRLGNVLPLFGGHLEQSWRKLDGLEEASVVKPSLANALLRLEDQGRLSLDAGKDARDVRLLEFSRFEPFDGVEGRLRPEQRRIARVRPGGGS